MPKQNPIHRALSNFEIYGSCSGDTLRQAYDLLEKYRYRTAVLHKVAEWFGLVNDDTGIYGCPFCDAWSLDPNEFTHVADCPYELFKGVLDGLSENTNET